MNLFQRILYYAGGFAAGLVILFFFLGGKRTSCDYSPDARVLKNVRIKKRQFTTESLRTLQEHQLDTAAVSFLLQKGDVDFDKSNTKLDSCRIYWVHGTFEQKQLAMTIENCDSIATIQKILIQ